MKDVDRARRAFSDSVIAQAVGGLIIGGFMAACMLVLWEMLEKEREITQGATAVLFSVFGYLAAIAQQVASWFFGSVRHPPKE